MSEIIRSLFGASVDDIQAQRDAQMQARAIQYGNMDNVQRANTLGYKAGGMLGQGLAGAMGYQDPQIVEARRRQELAKGIDLTTSDGVLLAIQKAKDANMPEQAAQLAQRYNELKDAETRWKYQAAQTAKAQIPTTKSHIEPNPDDPNQTIVVTETWNPTTATWDRETSSGGNKFNPKTGFGGNKAAELLDPETVDFMARQYLSGDRQVLTGFGRSPEALAKLKVAIVKNAKDKGISAEQLPAILADYKAFEAGAKATGTAQAKMTQAAMETNSLIGVAKKVVSDLKPGQYPGMNTISNFLNYQGGDPKITRLKNIFNGVVNTYARAISPTGQPTVSDKDHAREVLDAQFSNGQIQGAFDIMQQEMNAAIDAPREARKEIGRQRMEAVAPTQVNPQPTQKPVAKWGRDASGKIVKLP